MKINWTVRLKNPLWWVQMTGAVVLPVLAYFGLNWQDLTTWGAIWDLLVQSVQNPVVIISVLVSVFNAINDPTTSGMKDSNRAMTYTAPFKDKV